MLTIRRAAELTGISATTLRAWEARYGVCAPSRSESGYRLYDDADLREILTMSALVNSGWSPKQAAAELQRRKRDAHPTEQSAEHLQKASDELVAAARSADERSVSSALDLIFAHGQLGTALNGALLPALVQIGEEWRQGTVGIAGEHLVSAAVMRRLSVLYEAAEIPTTLDQTVVGLPAGGQHEIPALAFAVMLRQLGQRVTYLGPNVPEEAWLSAVDASPTSAVVISVTGSQAAAAAEASCKFLGQLRPGILTAVGGSHAFEVRSAHLRLPPDIAEAAQTLTKELQKVMESK